MKYRKKPVIIDAEQWDKKRDSQIDFDKSDPRAFVVAKGGRYIIETPEGEHEVFDKDYILRWMQHYSCKPSTFKETYEKAEE